MVNSPLLIGIFAILFIVAGFLFVSYDDRGGEAPADITTFEECVAAGNPVTPARQSLGVGGESYPRQCRTEDGKLFVEDVGNELGKSDLIRLDSPRPNDVVTSPLTIRGEARGSWFFEATFPVVLTDWDGKIIAQWYAEARDEWMTEDFVPFEGTLEFENPIFPGVSEDHFSRRGSLILQKANASGLPEHDDALEIPVRFAVKEAEGESVKLPPQKKETLPPQKQAPKTTQCDKEVANAQAFAQNRICTQQVAELTCPRRETTYLARNGCEISFLQNLGWTGQAGTNGSNDDNAAATPPSDSKTEATTTPLNDADEEGVEEEAATSAPEEPSIQTFSIDADDNGFYMNGSDIESITAGSGVPVSITFHVKTTGTYFGGLDFRGCGTSSSSVSPGESTVYEFTPDSACTISSYWPSSGVFKDSMQVIVE